MDQSRSGFTIVELLIVIVVIAILAAVVVLAYTGVQSRAVDSDVQLDTETNIKRMNMYYTTYGTWPQVWQDMLQSGKAGMDYGLTGTKRAYYVSQPTTTSNTSMQVCFYAPSTFGGWPGPTNATGEALVVMSSSGKIFSALTDSVAVQDISATYAANPSAGPCAAVATYYNIKVGGAWYMTPYITYSS